MRKLHQYTGRMNLGFHQHDDAACTSERVTREDALWVEEGVQFTPVRKRVLELLLLAHPAMGGLSNTGSVA